MVNKDRILSIFNFQLLYNYKVFTCFSGIICYNILKEKIHLMVGTEEKQ